MVLDVSIYIQTVDSLSELIYSIASVVTLSQGKEGTLPVATEEGVANLMFLQEV